MTSIFLAERWSRVGDTVSALNCQFASLAAQNRQKKICCVVLKATEEEKKDAADCGVELILPCLNEDIKDACENDEPCFKWLLSPENFFFTLTTLQNVEYIVEHIKLSTSFLFSSALRKRCFKAADIVLVNHASPSADFRNRNLKFAEAAAGIFSVGPTVFEEYKKLYQLTNIHIKHKLYLPRPENSFFDLNVDKISKISDLKQILTLVTDRKIESSRFEVLSAAIGRTAGLYHSMHQMIPTWFARITSGISLNDTRNVLRNNLKCSYIDANTNPPYGSQDDIYKDLKQSNVLVIPPDEPFRMEALWAIAAGLPVLVPRRTAMAEFLKYCFGNHAEYFLYEPYVDDLSDQICKMLNSTEAIGVTRQLKDKFQSHTDINQSQENFNSYLSEISQPNTLPAVLCEANLDIVEKRLKMETAQLMERKKQQLELQKEKDKQQFNIQKRQVLLAEIKELYELEKQKIMARNSPDVVNGLDKAYNKFKARLDAISDGSLQFMLSFLSEQDIDHFWQKYMAADVEEVVSGILITPKMRSLADEAGCTARIRLKIDKREYETVKEVLHDMSTEYTVPGKTWVRSVAWDKWERYVVDHVHENQAKYLIEQSRVHPVVNELRKDDFFFPSLASYWHDNFYTLPRTLTEATEYAINKDVVRYCEEHGIKIGNVYDVVQEGLHEVGKQAFHNFTSEVRSNASFYAKTGKKQIFCRKLSVSCNKRYLLCLLRKKHDNSFVFLNDHIYFYAVAVYLSTNLHEISEEGVLEPLVFCKPIALYLVAGILSDKLETFIEPVANYAQTVTRITFESLSLLGSCLLESNCPEKFGEILQRSFESLVLDLSSVTFASVSDYCKEALTFILRGRPTFLE